MGKKVKGIPETSDKDGPGSGGRLFTNRKTCLACCSGSGSVGKERRSVRYVYTV